MLSDPGSQMIPKMPPDCSQQSEGVEELVQKQSIQNCQVGVNNVDTNKPLVDRLSPKHIEDLWGSGITPEVAVQCGLYSVNSACLEAALGVKSQDGSSSGGLVFPFKHPLTDQPILSSGSGMPFVRVRMDDPSAYPDKNGKEAKYRSAYGSGQHAYFPTFEFAAFRAKPDKIFITEGEKKAIAACMRGMLTIGITGNWGWKVKAKDELIPELQPFCLPGVTVVLVWDSDAALNPSFAASTQKFYEAVKRTGCQVDVLVLPVLSAGKTGLDDYLLAKPVQEFKTTYEQRKLTLSDEQVNFCVEWAKQAASDVASLTDEDQKEVINILLSKLSNEKSKGRIADIVSAFSSTGLELADAVRDNLGMTLKSLTTSTTLNDSDLAGLFIRHCFFFSKRVCIRYYRGEFYYYSKEQCGFEVLPLNDLTAKLNGWLMKSYPEHTRHARYILELLRSSEIAHVPSSIEQPFTRSKEGFRHVPNVIPMRNGMLNIEPLLAGNWTSGTLELSEPSPEVFALGIRDYNYEPQATCPNFDRFLAEVLPDKALRDLLQEVFGYVQVCSTKFQVFFILHGSGANGKSVVCDVLEALTGPENCSAVPLTRFGERFSLHPLVSCLVNISHELPLVQKNSLAEDRLKAISSGNIIDVERKNRDIMKAKATARLVFAANELPAISDRSNGIWRRMIVIPFDVTIPPERQDPNLAQTIITEELPGVFNWAMQGLKRLMERGRFEEPEACRVLKDEYRADNAPEDEFLLSCLEEGSDTDFVPFADIYQHYTRHMDSVGESKLSKYRFGNSVKRLFPRADKKRGTVMGKTTRGYRRIKFKNTQFGYTGFTGF